MDSGLEEYLAAQRQKLKARKIQLADQIQLVKELEQQQLPSAQQSYDQQKPVNYGEFSTLSKNIQTSSVPQNIFENSRISGMDFSQMTDLNSNISKVPCSSATNMRPTNPYEFYDEITRKYSKENKVVSNGENISKEAKDLANRKEIQGGSGQNSARSRRSQSDMEQWVSDTFYSYFPSFNEEGQKRENLLRDRQLDYQNYLKQISEETDKAKKSSEDREIKSTKHTAKSDKTDIEIIVNNPAYNDKNREELPRPESTRHKLLQDLTHTDLSNILNSNAVQDRNRRSTELQVKRKKEYQQELLSQIEEKRKEIEILKEKEKKEEDLLTKKLEEQLKAMQLNEELEKEKRKIEKARLESEQNKAIQLHLLSKLEHDYKSHSSNTERQTLSEQDKESESKVDNKVYKYFSNSARQYENGRYGRNDLFDSFESEIHQHPLTKQIADRSKKAQSDCPHLSKIMCPFCDIKLKNYESWCKKCQTQVLDDGAENRSLLCENCEDQYLICAGCEKQNIPCSFCHRKRNICLHCISNYCVHCGRYIRETEAIQSSKSVISGHRSKPSSERSFQILELTHPVSEDNLDENDFIESGRQINQKPPYSMNLEKNSTFHPNNKVKAPKIELEANNGEMTVNSFWRAKHLDELKEETSSRLNKYFSNYGDLAIRNSKSKSTQTSLENTPQSEEYPLMPLLREIPKKKNLIDREKTSESSKNDRISNLSRKWEIPAVQRLTVSRSSPRVLTQVGAFRKQLQAEEFELED